MTVASGADSDDLDHTIARSKQDLPAKLPNYQLITHEPATLAGDRPAHLLGATYDMPGTGSLRTLQLVVVDSGKEYVVTATTPAVTFARYDSALRTALLSFSPAQTTVDRQLLANVVSGIAGSVVANGVIIGIMILIWRAVAGAENNAGRASRCRVGFSSSAASLPLC